MKESLSLVALAEELERQRDSKIDYLVPPGRMHFVSTAADPVLGTTKGSEIDLLGTRNDLHVGEVAHAQFSDRLKIPKRYYDRLRGEFPLLLDQNVNTLLQSAGRKHPDEKWMVRTLDDVARATLSSSYRRIDNDQIAEAILPVLRDIPDVQVRSAHISEKFMYIKATTPRVTGHVVGDEVCAGVFVRNSEVGSGKFVVAPFVETLRCTNGMVVMEKGSGMMEQIHLGRHLESDDFGQILTTETRIAQDRAFMMTVRDVVRTAVDEVRFRDLVEKMNRAAEDDPVNDVAGAIEVLAEREALTESEGRGILTYLAKGGDLSRWGVLSAVTRTAEDSDSYDRATELEAIGGKILNYGTQQWRSLVYAEKA